MSGAGSYVVVELTPVRGWHPDPASAVASELVCPVYDTLSESELALYTARPCNAAQFVARPKGRSVEEFTSSARRALQQAIQSGRYAHDPRPSFYVYGIDYVPPPDILETIPPADRRSRYLLLGLVGALEMTSIDPNLVAMHERTFADRVAERVALTEATGMSFAPIMLGYHRPDHAVNDLLERSLGLDRRRLAFEGSVPPVAEAVLDGTTHRLWRIDDPGGIEAISGAIRSLRVLVLDGHHRFTAAAHRHAQGLPSAPLTMLVEGEDRALRVLPWHRVLPTSVLPFAELVETARREFPEVLPLEGATTVESVVRRLEAMRRQGARGFLATDGVGGFEVRGAPGGDVGRDFDLLHEFLEERLGIDPHDLEFVRSPRAALERTAGGSGRSVAGTALLLPGLTEAGIEERAFGSATMMAHKSTMFLPKVADGMLFAPADGDRPTDDRSRGAP